MLARLNGEDRFLPARCVLSQRLFGCKINARLEGHNQLSMATMDGGKVKSGVIQISAISSNLINSTANTLES
jgi:hypothetical protein